jgi:hypothetical protein
LYLLTLDDNYVRIKEMECYFASADKIEVRLTLFAYGDALKTFKSDTTIYTNEVRVLNYSYKNGYLEIPDLKLTTKLDEDEHGDYITNTKEVFYQQSIVDLLNTEEGNSRTIKASSTPNVAPIYLKMLQGSTNNKPAVTIKDGIIHFEDPKNKTNIDNKDSYHFDKDDLVSVDASFRDYPTNSFTGTIKSVNIDVNGTPRSFIIHVNEDVPIRNLEVVFDYNPVFGPNMDFNKFQKLKELVVANRKVKVEVIKEGTSAGYLSCRAIEPI